MARLLDAVAERDVKIDERDAKIAERDEEIAKLKARVGDLETQLGQNSTNSQKPPSTDAPGTRASKPTTGKQRGAQPGHKPNKRVLLPPEKVTRRTVVKPSACKCCGSRRLKGLDGDPRRHQVIDVPEIQPDVHEIVMHGSSCRDCGKTTWAELPDGVPAHMFGPRLLALIGYLLAARTSRRSLRELLAEVFAIPVSRRAQRSRGASQQRDRRAGRRGCDARARSADQARRREHVARRGRVRGAVDDRDEARERVLHRGRRSRRHDQGAARRAQRDPRHRPRHAVRILGDGPSPDLLGAPDPQIRGVLERNAPARRSATISFWSRSRCTPGTASETAPSRSRSTGWPPTSARDRDAARRGRSSCAACRARAPTSSNTTPHSAGSRTNTASIPRTITPSVRCGRSCSGARPRTARRASGVASSRSAS